jgi:hypothetical protein
MGADTISNKTQWQTASPELHLWAKRNRQFQVEWAASNADVGFRCMIWFYI